MTFQEPEVEPDPKVEEGNYPPGPSILDVKAWLDWQACQLSTPCWWGEFQAILGLNDLQDLGLLFNSQSKEQGLPGARVHCAPCS